MMVVDEERADFEGGGFVGLGVGGGVGLDIRDAADGSERNGVDFGVGSAEGWSADAQDCQQEHRSGAEDLHSARVRMRVRDYKVDQADCLLAERILRGMAGVSAVYHFWGIGRNWRVEGEFVVVPGGNFEGA